MTCFRGWLNQGQKRGRDRPRAVPPGFRTKVKPVSGTLGFYQAGEGQTDFRAARGLRETKQMSRPRFWERNFGNTEMAVYTGLASSADSMQKQPPLLWLPSVGFGSSSLPQK